LVTHVVCNNTTENGDNVGKEGEHLGDGNGGGRAEAEGTSGLVYTHRALGNSTGTVTASGEAVVDKVVERAGSTVVRGTLSELDGAHGEGDEAGVGVSELIRHMIENSVRVALITITITIGSSTRQAVLTAYQRGCGGG
jgi:hypothetical protein